MNTRSLTPVWAAFVLTAVSLGSAERFDEELSHYKETVASGPAGRFEARMQKEEPVWQWDAKHGYLPAVLSELGIPVSSQLLVASKTSPNKALISPHRPRALYYNSSFSVAYVPGAPLLELAACDPKLGVVFYTLEQKELRKPKLKRDNRCLECHSSAKTLDVPGLLIRSFLTHEDGDVDVLSGLMVNHRTPVPERWGGYYVTGITGQMTHRGNVFGAELGQDAARQTNRNIVDLGGMVDISRYPVPTSDVVSLLVIDHQAHMLNLLGRVAFEASAGSREEFGTRRAYPAIEAALRYMLFVDEYALSSPVRGFPAFAHDFENLAPKDSKGRSFSQLDLKVRLLKYPCSYLIYSETFAALPAGARKHFYRRLWEVLNGEERSKNFSGMYAETRQAIREILISTKPDLPEYWRL